jgi:lysophospholipase L1-like esterase
MTIYNVLTGPRNTSSGQLLYSANKRRTLMFIGDSITWGFGVTQNQAFPALVQAQADAIAGGTNTAMWTARNVQCDDISVGRDTGAPWNVPFKLTSPVGIAYDGVGPFASTFSNTISSTGPAILFDGNNDEFTVSPSTACQYITVMVKVSGSGTATLSAFRTGGVQIFDVSGNNGNATVGGTPLVPTAPNVFRFVFDATTTSTAFLLRRSDTNTSASMRILTVNPTNLYPTSNYVQVQINARGSYTASDYISNIASIMETVIHPQNEALPPPLPAPQYTNDYPAFVLSVGTVSMYFDPSLSSSFDRRISPSDFRDNLNALVNAIKAASPNSPIFLTLPPIATSPWVLSAGLTRSQYDAEIQSLAISQKLPVIDLRSALTAGDYSDGIHPTAAGQIKLAAVYNAALRF